MIGTSIHVFVTFSCFWELCLFWPWSVLCGRFLTFLYYYIHLFNYNFINYLGICDMWFGVNLIWFQTCVSDHHTVMYIRGGCRNAEEGSTGLSPMKQITFSATIPFWRLVNFLVGLTNVQQHISDDIFFSMSGKWDSSKF